MLLTQLIAQQQSNYAQIQAQIEALQEQQRRIQAHLQRLGSVESQMVSAVQVMSEALASINEVCPDELANYKDLICGLFNKPTAALPGHDGDDDPEPTDPIPPSVEPMPAEDETIEAVAEVVSVSDERQTVMQEIAQKVDLMTYAQIRTELASRRLNNKGNHAVLKDRLIQHYKGLDETELKALALMPDGQQQAAA